MDVPNEIWIKIMNYLPTDEICHKFGLVSKQFHSFTSSVRHLHCKIVDLKISDTVLKIVKNSRTIIALNFDFVNDSYRDNTFANTFINQALHSCQKLKVLRIHAIYGRFEIKMEAIEILQKFGAQFEHLEFAHITMKPEVLIEVSKLKYLKSLGLRGVKTILPNGDILQTFHSDTLTDIVQNLIKSATQLEAIDFEFQSRSPELTKIYNRLIEAKKDILKKVGATNYSRHGSCPRSYRNQCNSFETINECKNIEELCGKLHPHEFQHIQSKLKKTFYGKIE